MIFFFPIAIKIVACVYIKENSFNGKREVLSRIAYNLLFLSSLVSRGRGKIYFLNVC